MVHFYWRVRTLAGTYGAVAEWIPYDGIGAQIATTGGTASADDSTFGAAANAFDGNAGTFWNPSGPNTFPHWLQYQFPSAVEIASFTITARGGGFFGDSIVDFDLQFSDDGATWFTKYSYRGVYWTTNGQVITFDASNALPALGITWRVRLNTAYATTNELEIGDVVFRDSGGTAIATTRYAATAYSTYTLDASHGAYAAFNGDGNANFWAANAFSTPGWIAYRFGSSLVTVASFCITQPNNQGASSVTLQYSFDETNWTSVETVALANINTQQCFTLGATFPFLSKKQRGNIDEDQIGLDARHGPAGILVQYSDGTGTPGNLARYLADGSIGDSGVASGTGVAGTPLTVNGPATVAINSVDVSFDGTVFVNGV